MTLEEPQSDDAQPRYRTGYAARLAGIPVETLRVWERRYRVVGPRLTVRGHRLYSADDVSRLGVIKSLVDLGNPIRSVANLPLDALRRMQTSADEMQRTRRSRAVEPSQPVRVALIGSVLAETVIRDAAMRPSLDIVATGASVDDALTALRGMTVDVLVVQLPTLHPGVIANVDEWVGAAGARHAIVEYRFAPASLIASLRSRGHDVVKAPLGGDDLERLCRATAATAGMESGLEPSPLSLATVPPRRFDDESLGALAGASTTLDCECPRHVVDLLVSLSAFERYSLECADRSPADAVLHRHLHHVAGSARALFEEALVRLARAEGIALPEAAAF